MHEPEIELGGSPNQAVVHAIAAWAVIEVREVITDALRSYTETVFLGGTRQTNVEDSDDSDYKEILTGTCTLEEKLQSPHCGTTSGGCL